MILLDTNALIWLTAGSSRLGPEAMTRIEASTTEGQLFMSVISFWEIAMLVDKNRLALHDGLTIWATEVLERPGVRLAQIDPATALDAGSLPGDIHGDPADRIIVATARALGCPLLTSDERILAYAEAGHVSAVDARL